ncbi:hypothetical protein ACWEO9_04865 [Streptomyces albidoflavus]|uniref:hypothetical protein n=1 Tax=Streptomyces sp. AJ-1 TaxID=3044384 RepID=UPI00249A1C81|nr:hypothetical protein [Streptomyces sp. AJ-1]MDI3342387.1 hypothetical protein [Streptomyces sp. AJ-1]
MGSRESEYTLKRWKAHSGSWWHRKHGYQGSLGNFGRVEVETPVRIRGNRYVTEIQGKSVPFVAFCGWQYGGKPSLVFGELTVAGEIVPVQRDRWALSRQGRALRFEVDGRAYRYYAPSRRHRHRALAREGVGVEIVTRRPRRGEGKSATVSVRGPADAMDVALAVLLCGVNTRNLTPGGAVRTFLYRVFPFL